MGNTQSERRFDKDIYYVSSSDEEDEESELETTVAREAAGGTVDAAGKTTTIGTTSQTGTGGVTCAAELGEDEEPIEPDLDLCGLEPDVSAWEEVPPGPPIRESRLTPEEKAKFRSHLAIIF